MKSIFLTLFVILFFSSCSTNKACLTCASTTINPPKPVKKCKKKKFLWSKMLGLKNQNI